MSSRRFVPIGFGVLLLWVAVALAQLDLGGGIRSQSVREWKYVPTVVESVEVRTEVGHGIATTTMTLVLEPQVYRGYEYVLTGDSTCVESGERRSCKPEYERVWSDAESVDSIEIAAHFTLPTDFVAQELWLWVGDERVRGEIQDRALARGQYEEIVNRRRDPALLEFWGNGSYNLRIFPARSFQARKVAIQWQHTLDDDSLDLVTAAIPLTFDSSSTYQYDTTSGRAHSIDYMKAILSARDGRTYRFAMPGLGSGTFTSQPLVLEKRDIRKLTAGTVSAPDPGGASTEYMWASPDVIGGKKSVGFAVQLSESSVTLDPEPATRVIALDIHGETWHWADYYRAQYDSRGYDYQNDYWSGYDTIALWERAQKYAVLALMNYAGDGKRFNLVIGEEILFEQPVAATETNLRKAFEAIRDAAPSEGGDRRAVLQSAIEQAGGDIVVLISDLYQPADYYVTRGDVWEVSASGNAYDELVGDLGEMVKTADVTLFTIADDWRLSTMAYNSGGYSLTSLRWYRYYWHDGQPDRSSGIDLPPLYGEYNRHGVYDVKVTGDEGLTDLVYTYDGSGYYWWWRGPVMMEGVAMAKRGARTGLAKLVVPDYGTTSMLRVAAHTVPGRNATTFDFTVKGKMGGLGFTKEISAAVGSMPHAATVPSEVQHAFRTTEYLATLDWQEYADSIKAIGKHYHIVTRQTSLLALEPGMTMWEDTTAPDQANARGGEASSAPFASNAEGAVTDGSGQSAEGDVLDEVSLEDLIAGTAVFGERARPAALKPVTVVAARNGIAVSIPSRHAGKPVALRLYDVGGRQVMARVVKPGAIRSGTFVWDLRERALAGGHYVLRVRIGAETTTFRLPLVGR